MTSVVGYHGSHELKARFIAHVERHRVMDMVRQGTYGMTGDGIWWGCAVACSLRSLDEMDGKPLQVDNRNHAELARRLGIPLVLARLEDRIFEGISPTDALLWPTLFARAIPVGGDLSLVWPKFAHWMLADGTSGVIRFAKTQRARDAVQGVADLYAELIAGGAVSMERWIKARPNAAAYAANAAAYAAYAAYAANAAANAAAYAAANAAAYAAANAAADDAADAAYAAAYAAANAAANAAYAAADDAADAAYAANAADAASSARTRHCQIMGHALLRFMMEAPVAA